MNSPAIELLVPRPIVAQPLSEPCALPCSLSVVRPGHEGTLGDERILWPLRSLVGSSALGAPLLDLREVKGGSGGSRAIGSVLELQIDDSLPEQAYALEIRGSSWTVRASSAVGAAYACCTLAQWLRLHSGQGVLPGLTVEDRPLLADRGVMLDVSRNKVPRLQTLLDLIDRLALLKINHLQLYTEHTFAYAGHERVWREWSPLTAADLSLLARKCRERFIDLVPNQNSFGHFHRWLVHEPYRSLAECPEGIEHPFSRELEPFSLCATDQRVPELLTDLYDQLLPNFLAASRGSSLFNVGLDETFDLGLGRSAEAVERNGRAKVYLDFLHRVHRLCDERERRMLFWGDIVVEHPELVDQLPDDAVALVWGYEQDHDWQGICQRFADAGVEHWVCPGTSAWNSFAGRLTNALRNISRATVGAADHGATGLLVTEWGDSGHLQPLLVSGPAFLAAAACGWNLAEVSEHDVPDGEPTPDHQSDLLARRLDWWWIEDPDPGLGAALLALGDLYRQATREPLAKGPMNGSNLFHLFSWIDSDLNHQRFRSLSAEGLGRAARAAESIQRGLAGRATSRSRDDLLWLCEMVLWCCDLGLQRLTVGRDQPTEELELTVRTQLADRLTTLADRRRHLWLRRNRRGGWHESQRHFDRAVDVLTPTNR